MPTQHQQERQREFLAAYNQYADDIYRHCYFRVYNKELAEDITQETFIKTWKYITEGKEVKNIRAFLYKVAVNLIVDHSRKKKPVLLEDSKEQEVVVRQPHNREELKILGHFEYGQLVQSINQLEDNYRQVIVMRHVDGLLPMEIAAILGESPNAVSVRINQGIKKLRRLMAQKYHYEES